MIRIIVVQEYSIILSVAICQIAVQIASYQCSEICTRRQIQVGTLITCRNRDFYQLIEHILFQADFRLCSFHFDDICICCRDSFATERLLAPSNRSICIHIRCIIPVSRFILCQQEACVQRLNGIVAGIDFINLWNRVGRNRTARLEYGIFLIVMRRFSGGTVCFQLCRVGEGNLIACWRNKTTFHWHIAAIFSDFAAMNDRWCILVGDDFIGISHLQMGCIRNRQFQKSCTLFAITLHTIFAAIELQGILTSRELLFVAICINLVNIDVSHQDIDQIRTICRFAAVPVAVIIANSFEEVFDVDGIAAGKGLALRVNIQGIRDITRKSGCLIGFCDEVGWGLVFDDNRS